MYKITIITVGKVKTPFWQSAIEHYRKRLSKSWQVAEVLIKDATAALPTLAKKQQEGERILAALPAGYACICLDEHGENLPSVNFAGHLEKLALNSFTPCFVIGGAYGLSQAVLQKASKKISFGVMTFPHELAQVLLWEQLFRADAIMRKTGYHHE